MTQAFTFMDMVRVALKSAPTPMSAPELWAYAETKKLTDKLTSVGKTPWHSLGALLYVDTKENTSSEFIRVGRRPVRFWLRTRPFPHGWSAVGPGEGAKDVPVVEPDEPQERRFLEKDLHPVLVAFARTQLNGVRAKTIQHTASTKKRFGEWVHPDVVGVRFPLSALGERITVEFAGTVRAPIIRLFSFELKRSVDFSNLRECFFQAVSNSSWAHEGYLVAARWLDDDEFDEELTRLSQSFGIGAIHLCLDDFSASRVVHPARVRDDLDWVTLDKLVAMNSDVAHFLETVKIDLNANRIHDAEYDAVPADPDAYAKRLVQPEAKTKKGKAP
ncbi:MAG: hypothetical protein IT376_07115 [Polyangiaceae bacterium]|nr:hypothetical protein [Polyangiaceae bacterium]